MPSKNKSKNREYVKKHYYKNKADYLARNRDKRRKLKEYIQSLKDDAICTDCNLPYPSYVLEFDHTRGIKICPVSRCTSWKALYEELEKCDLVCANCHTIRTHNRKAA